MQLMARIALDLSYWVLPATPARLSAAERGAADPGAAEHGAADPGAAERGRAWPSVVRLSAAERGAMFLNRQHTSRAKQNATKFQKYLFRT